LISNNRLISPLSHQSDFYDTFRLYPVGEENCTGDTRRSHPYFDPAGRLMAYAKSTEKRQAEPSYLITHSKKLTVMKMEPHIARRMFRNALLSLFIYALPFILMFFTFYVTGQRPWSTKAHPKNQVSAKK
jgi:hypothetical protein